MPPNPEENHNDYCLVLLRATRDSYPCPNPLDFCRQYNTLVSDFSILKSNFSELSSLEPSFSVQHEKILHPKRGAKKFESKK